MRPVGSRRLGVAGVALACLLAIGVAAGSGAGAQRPPAPRSARPLVLVPRVALTGDVLDIYRSLHAVGLRLAIPERLTLASLCMPSMQRQSPAPGTPVPRGTAVAVRKPLCTLGSPVVTTPLPRARVPNLVGKRLGRAVTWAEDANLYWSAPRLPPLRPSRRRELLDNYVITRQRPAASAVLSLGVDCSKPGSDIHCFRPTPLTLRTREPRR